MTTHELARTLEILAAALRSAPDSDLKTGENISSLMGLASPRIASPRKGLRFSLARLAKFSKAELIAFMRENDIPITIRQKDSASNVMRRLSIYLEANKGLKKRIRNKVAHGRTSPELSSALSYLLRDSYE